MGLAALHRTLQEITRTETPCTNAEEVVVAVAAVIVVNQETSSSKHEFFTFKYWYQ